MRVGLFTESYDPIINGVSTSVKTLAGELITLAHAPIIVAPRYPDFADDGQPSVLRLPSLPTPFAYRFVPPPLGSPPAMLRKADLDIVHTQQPFGLGRHGLRYARQYGVPLISTYHTLYNEYTHYFPLLPKRATQTLLCAALRPYYNACDTIIVPSRAAGRVLEGMGVTVPIRVVPTGVPEPPAVIPAAVEQARCLYGLTPNTPVLLYVGRIAREKNLDLLIEAFARLEVGEGMAQPLLLFVGSGPYLAACRTRVRQAGIEARVRFTGFLKRSQLAPIYASATLFVFPSVTDTQGVVLSEAQSFGLPCVVVNGGGAPEFVRDNVDALVVPPDRDAFRDALAALLADTEKRRAMAAAALSSPLRPTPTDMARQITRVYEAAREVRKENAAS